MPPAPPRGKTVATIDDVDGLEEDAARTLSRRLWYLGWCGLPLLWAMNAYLFYPHIRDDDDDASAGARHLDVDGEGSSGGSSSEEEEDDDAPRRARAVAVKDVVVARYAGRSLAGAKVAGGILLAWAATFALGVFERVFGEERWRALALSSWIEI
jgi:hypothetical protein